MDNPLRSRIQPPPRTKSSGFTLIELVMTIAVAAIFAAVAIPSLRSFIVGQRVKTAAYDVFFSLTLSRSEAMKRNQDVVFAPATGGWQNGWTVVAGTITLAQHEPFPDLVIAGPTAAGLTYTGTGRLKTLATPFDISGVSGSNATPRCVSVDLSGLPSSKTGGC